MCVCLQFALHTFFFLDRKLFKNQKQLLPLVTITNRLFWEKAKQERGRGWEVGVVVLRIWDFEGY